MPQDNVVIGGNVSGVDPASELKKLAEQVK